MAGEEEEQEERKSQSRSPTLLILAVGMVALLLGAGGTYLVVGAHGDTAEAADSARAETSAEQQTAAVPFAERIVPLDPFVVNISSDQYPRYLKLQIQFEVERPEQKEEITSRMAQIRDALIVLITSKRLSDLSAFEGKALLKEEILDRINGLVDEPVIRSVLFTEFVIQ